MLVEQTLEKLAAMKLHGMATELRRLTAVPDTNLTPFDVVGLLADAEWTHRDNKRLTSRLRQARFGVSASVEEIDYSLAKGLKKSEILDLATCGWLEASNNVILTGPTGVGKSFLACALGQRACRLGFSVVYRRASRLFDEAAQARADGTFPVLLRRLAKTRLLILDDFALEPLGAPERKVLLEILEDRYGQSSTIVTSQLDPSKWHAIIGDPTLADAISDRLVHNAHRLNLQGESIRKLKASRKPPR